MRKIIFILVFALFSCGANKNSDNKSFYNLSKNIIFPDSLTIYIPSEDEVSVDFIAGITASNAFEENMQVIPKKSDLAEFIPFTFLQEYKISNNNVIDSLINKYQVLAIKRLEVLDTSYFIIDTERNLSKKFNKNSLKNLLSKKENYFFVINFNSIYPSERNWTDDSTTCGLTKDFIIYIFKYGKTAVLDEEILYEWDLLPEEIKHGYSCGAAISKEKSTLLYWVLAW